MSISSRNPTSGPHRNRIPAVKRDQTILNTAQQIDSTFQHLIADILPKHPYLISIPSEIPYRHSSRFVNTWHVGTPFQREEEQIQYISFLPHNTEEESLLKVLGGWSDDSGNPVEEPSPPTTFNSGRNTPIEGIPRKKISLKEYKSKDKVAAVESAANSRVEEKPTQPTDQTVAATQVNSHSARKVHNTSRGDDIDSNSRSQAPEAPQEIPMMDGTTSPPSVTTKGKDSPRPEKRRRISPPSPGPRNISKSKRELPKLLSPTLPAQAKHTLPALPKLPKRLSPALPPSLEKAIELVEENDSEEKISGHKRTDSVRSMLLEAGIGTPKPFAGSQGPANGSLHVGSNHVRSSSQNSIRSTTSEIADQSKAQTPLAKPLNRGITKVSTPIQAATRLSPGPRQRHTIILKYGKKNRKRVEALLNFSKKPKKPATRELDTTMTRPESRKGLAEEAPKAVKRPMTETPEGAVKRLKPSSGAVKLERPSTPHLSQKSPAMPDSAQSRGPTSTPKSELKSAAMRRIASTESGDGRTPGTDKFRSSTPLGVERPSRGLKTSPAPPSSTSAKDDDNPWMIMNKRYFALGRKLKHQGQDAPPNSGLSVALLVEALACFMISTAAKGIAQPNADPDWHSILPYHIFVFRTSRKYLPLHGLVVQLGAVCRQYVHKYDMDRLAKDPLPDEQCSAPTPGSDGNTKTLDDAEKYKKRYLDFRDNLVMNAKELRTAWLDGSRLLSPDILEKEYPRTWVGRARDFSSRSGGGGSQADKHTSPTRISMDYYLPLDASSGVFEAVRFTLRFLSEWSTKEGIDWKAKIDL